MQTLARHFYLLLILAAIIGCSPADTGSTDEGQTEIPTYPDKPGEEDGSGDDMPDEEDLTVTERILERTDLIKELTSEKVHELEEHVTATELSYISPEDRPMAMFIFEAELAGIIETLPSRYDKTKVKGMTDDSIEVFILDKNERVVTRSGKSAKDWIQAKADLYNFTVVPASKKQQDENQDYRFTGGVNLIDPDLRGKLT